MVSGSQRKPFWLVTQLHPQNDWTGWQNGMSHDTHTGPIWIPETASTKGLFGKETVRALGRPPIDWRLKHNEKQQDFFLSTQLFATCHIPRKSSIRDPMPNCKMEGKERKKKKTIRTPVSLGGKQVNEEMGEKWQRGRDRGRKRERERLTENERWREEEGRVRGGGGGGGGGPRVKNWTTNKTALSLILFFTKSISNSGGINSQFLWHRLATQ